MKPDTIVIHHSATPDNRVLSNWEAIRRYHVEVHGWQDIGYHFGIEHVDGLATLRKGRDIWTPGAQCKGHNSHSIGVVTVGDWTYKAPPEDKLSYLASFVTFLCAALNVPVGNVKGHREMSGANTECPGRMFDMEGFRARIAALARDYNAAECIPDLA